MNYLLKKTSSAIIIIFFVLSGCAGSQGIKETGNGNEWSGHKNVKSQKFDTGKMWTFENAPVDYFDSTYGFRPTQEWLDKTRMAALKFGNWCTSSFVSQDGLIMTNHHCVDFISKRIEHVGENIHKNGFWAPSLDDERKVPNLYVDQLVLIEDVTDEILDAESTGKSDDEREILRKEKINDIEHKYSEKTGLKCRVTPLYEGARYSLYCYRRYNDVRVVFIAESEMGLYGGDPDNFTYPRYNLDCSFLRVYDDGKPLQTENYFKWSSDGAVAGEPLFIVGNPGSTNRLKTISQLKYMRDYTYRNASAALNGLIDIYNEIMEKNPEKTEKYRNGLIYLANSAKVYKGELKALQNPYLMARKQDFENKFRNAVTGNTKLNIKYGFLWDRIDDTQNELRKYAPEIAAYSISRRTSSRYFIVASKLLSLADQLNLPEDKRDTEYKSDKIDETIGGIFPGDFDFMLEDLKLVLNADIIEMNIGAENPTVKKLFGGLSGEEAAAYALSHSFINTKEKMDALIKKGANAILNSDDPFIYFIKTTQPKLPGYKAKIKEIKKTEKVLDEELGKALYEVYGTSIPPDATFTLRITDGVMKSYPYNGTIAPMFTTFYGLYDKYYSHEKEFPWDISEKWKNPTKDFDMETPFNFISTCDVTGGSSGSPVINQRREIVGLAFDGNIESLDGDFIYLSEKNRTVAVASQGIVEAVSDVYNYKRLSRELIMGRIADEVKSESVTERTK